MTSTGKKEKNQHIQVFVRVRPLNKQEGNTNCTEIRNHKELMIKHHSTTRTYNFDKIFGPDSKQLDVYKLVAEPTVREVISGYNCTVLAYGQTGTGKTYTMAGGTVTDMNNPNTNSAWFEDVHSGIIPRTLSHMFDELRVQQVEYTVRVSYLELYNEEIFDLLSPVEDNNKLKLYDDNMKKGSVIVSGLTETTVNTKSEVFRILEKGAEKRRIASTLMNAQSSRSHTVFCIIVHTKENSIDGEDLLKTGKLYLVDLAGSENIKQSGATDVRARETFSINQSLLTLGRCISKLIERSGHIPYRESKLTRLLQDSLGGRTKTTLIATISPATCNADESINTLEYASRAKNITNKPEINQRLSKKTLMKEYTEEIERLRKDLLANRMGKGIFLDEENYESLMRERDIHKDEITEKINMIRVMQEEMMRKEQLCEQLKIYLEEHQKEVEIKVTTINTLENQLQEASKEITGLQEENDLKQFMVGKYSETEEQLKSTAKELLTVAETTTVESRKLHDKLDTLSDITKQNKQVCEQHIVEFSSKMTGISNSVQTAFDSVNHFIEKCKLTTETLLENTKEAKNKSQELLVEIENQTDKHNKFNQDIQFNSESKRIAYDLASSNISDSCDNEFTSVQDKFSDTLVSKILEVHEYNTKREKEIVDFTTNLKETIADHNSTMNEFFNSSKDLIRKTREIEHQHIKHELDVVAKLEVQLQKQKEERNAYKSEMHSKQRQVMEMMKSMMDLTEEYTRKSQEQTFVNEKEMDSLKNYLEERKTSYSATSDETINYIDKFSKDMCKTTQEYDEIIKTHEKEQAEHISSIKNVEDQTNEAFKICMDYTHSSFNNVQTVCIQEYENIQNIDDTYHDSVSTYSKDISDWLISHKTAIESESNTRCKTNTQLLETMCLLSKELDSRCNEMEPRISTDLDNSREGIRKLFTSSLKEYKVTGETPQRKAYRYPKTLVETKPKEKLVEEYYTLRLADQIAEEKEDESGNENIENSIVDAQFHSRIPTKIETKHERNLTESNMNRQNLKERTEDNQ